MAGSIKKLLCKLGLHARDKDSILIEFDYNNNGDLYKYRYRICKRCGKILSLVDKRMINRNRH